MTLVAAVMIGVGLVLAGVEDVGARALTALYRDATARTRRRLAGIGVATGGAGVVLVIAAALPIDGILAVWALLTIVLLVMRGKYQLGEDGADRMSMTVLALIALGEVARVSTVTSVAWGWTVVAVVGVAYAESGLVKVLVPSWRGGRALALIMNTPEFGQRTLARFLLDRPRLSFVVCWGVIVLELAALPAFVAGGPVLMVAVVLLALMHVGIAVTMGLGRFFWAFGGALALVVGAHPAG